ncbi:MAG: VanZ family protein [Cyanobacteria bacterium J06626_18]
MTNRPSPHAANRWHFVALCYAVIFLSILWLAYTNRIPTQFIQFLYADKVAHTVLYAIAAYLGQRWLRSRHLRIGGVSLPFFPALFGLFTLVEELVQSLSPYRTFDLGDLVCSFGGILLGWWLVGRSRPKQEL